MRTDKHSAVTVGEISDWLHGFAPSGLAEPWDNVGIIAGSRSTAVTRAVTALDVTPGVIRYAAAQGAQLIVSHHPPIFKPISQLDGNSIPYLIARHGLCAIAAHTNLDRATGGVNDLLAMTLGLTDIYTAPDGLCRVGKLPEPMDCNRLSAYVARTLGAPDVRAADNGRVLRTVAVCGGAGGEYLEGVAELADAFVTGEMKYHEWPYEPAVTVIEAGHFYTEIAISAALANMLGRDFPQMEVFPAPQHCPYRCVSH